MASIRQLAGRPSGEEQHDALLGQEGVGSVAVQRLGLQVGQGVKV